MVAKFPNKMVMLGISGAMLHSGIRQSFVDAWSSCFPHCDLAVFVWFNILMFSAYFTCQWVFGRSSMPRWLRDDPAIMSYTVVATLPVILVSCLGILCISILHFFQHFLSSSKMFVLPYQKNIY